MKKIRFTTLIGAQPEAVWNTMLGLETYRDWTSEFAEGCYYEGSWDEGAKIRFLSPGGQGMVARIVSNRPHEFLSIEHQGFIKDGVEDTTSEAVRTWTPAFENYAFRDVGGATELAVEMDVTEEWADDLSKMWPKALARLKALCESRKA